MAPALEVGLELPVVVDLAVLDDHDAAVLVAYRLVAAFQVDDRQAPVRDPHDSVDVRSAMVGPPMVERVARPTHRLGIHNPPVRRNDPANAAHSRSV